MRETLLILSGKYLLVAAIDPELPLWARRTCEYTGLAFDWLVTLGTANEELTASA